MNKVLYIILISLFSLTVFSCSSNEDSKTASTDNSSSSSDHSSDDSLDNSSSTSWNGTYGTIVVPASSKFNIGSGNLSWSGSLPQQGYFYTGTNYDYLNPVQVAGVTSSSDCNSSYKGYTGLSDINDLSDASSLTYSIAPSPNNSQGAVYIASKSETSCDNEGMLVFTQAGRYGVLDFISVSSDYNMTIKWWLGASGVTDFSQAPDPDTTAPTVTSVSTTADNQSSVSITDNITVTFSEAMDTTYVTTNTSDTYCSGTLSVSSDNFSTCVKMSSSPSSSNSNKTFTLDPYDNLTVSTTYKTRVTTGVKDTAGNTLSSQYETSSGFTTTSSSSSSSSSGVFVAVGDSGNILRSTDNGSSWANASTPLGSGLYAVTFGNNTFVAIGNGGKFVKSTDNGSSFDNVTSGISKNTSDVTYGNNTFIAVAHTGTIVRSTDNGSSWNNATSGTGSSLWGVGFGNNTFVVVGNSGNILKSTDNGSSWDNVTSGTSQQLNNVTFGNNTFVGVGDNGNILRSTDNGTNWDNATSGITTDIRGVTFGNNTFVGVGSGGKIVRSMDNGSSWDNATSPITTNIPGVTFGNNTFVAVGASGNIVRSTDNGSSFDNVTSGTSQSLRGVAFSGNWQLIARQVDSDNFTDGTNELFSSNARTTFLQNENDPSSSTFMSIGNLNKNNYDTDGKYKFKLVWDGMEMASEDIKEVTWTQTSWLTDSTTQGFQEIGVSGFNTGAASNTDFVGLALSTSSQCVIDGDGGTVSDKWFNCVGLINLWLSSMPGPLGKKASSMHLYIWVP